MEKDILSNKYLYIATNYSEELEAFALRAAAKREGIQFDVLLHEAEFSDEDNLELNDYIYTYTRVYAPSMVNTLLSGKLYKGNIWITGLIDYFIDKGIEFNEVNVEGNSFFRSAAGSAFGSYDCVVHLNDEIDAPIRLFGDYLEVIYNGERIDTDEWAELALYTLME